VKSRPRYVIKPGFVNPEKRIGFKTSRQLAALYGLKDGEYCVFDPTEPAKHAYLGMIPLGPRAENDYLNYVAATDRFSERLNARFMEAVQMYGKPSKENGNEIARVVTKEIQEMENEGWFPKGFAAEFGIVMNPRQP